jgi:hypothetical protein
VLSDAFPYIWQKRLLAEEMLRQAGPDGTIVMPHLHSSLGWNYSAGMTLTPASYASLFAPLQPRLFPDDGLFEQTVAGSGLDLGSPLTPEALGSANSFTLIASRQGSLFRRYPAPNLSPVNGDLVVNPLYRVSRDGPSTVLTLRFPTRTYEDEFGDCRRYLPDSLVVRGDLTAPIISPPADLDVNGLRRRRVLIDAPRHYC